MSFQSAGDRPDISKSGRAILPDPSTAAKWLMREVFGVPTATGSQGAESRPVVDTNVKLAAHHASFLESGRVCLGHIIDGSAISNCYRVHVEKGQAPIPAIPLSHTSNACFGATAINSYVPGTPVVVMVHDKVKHGWILGAVPALLQTGQRAYHDYISQASRKRVDDCHKRFIKLPMSGEMVDASAWRPFDQTLASEWGAITTTGCKVTLDDFMVQVAVNEMCGIWGFYHDSLLRIAGYNMQVWTAGAETEDYMDQSEAFNFKGWTPYAWEGAGAQEGQTNVREFVPDDYQCAKGCPWYAHWENVNDYVQGFHRTQLWHGYLGQGQRLLVQVPPIGQEVFSLEPGGAKQKPEPAYDSPIPTADGGGGKPCGGCSDAASDPKPSDTPPIVLHEDNVALDGRRFMASAKGIVIAKRMLLTPSIRRKRPDNPTGDDAETNYKSAGKHGKGPKHPITGDMTANDDYSNLQRASAVLDLHAYLFNYAGVHAFYWHKEDFKTWEEDELKHAEYQHVVPDFNQLRGSMYLREPSPKNINIDHRYNDAGKNQNFYETTSAISLLEDGSIVISDGYGAEIKMSAGCLILSAPGDVWMKSGRHCQMWSGGDGIIRANGAVELSTTEKSIRIKSEKDVMVLAGNKDNHGGVLIESRGKLQTYDFEKAGDDVEFGGVVLRAPESNVVALAHQIYLRSGGGDNSMKPGNITIDAGKGTKDIVTKSNRIFNYVGENGAICNFFSIAEAGDPQVAHYFAKDYVLLSGDMAVQKNIIGGGGVLTRDFLLCNGPILGDSVAFPCTGKCEKDINEAINKIVEYIYKILPATAKKYHDDYLSKLWYEAKRAGNDLVMDIMEFSFRTDEQYKKIIPDFMLYEDRWQQMARITGKISKTWTEKEVKSAVAGATYPFPGGEWLNAPVYRTQDFNLLEKVGEGFRDKKRGKDGNLDSKYREPTCEASKPKKINGVYPIIGTP